MRAGDALAALLATIDVGRVGFHAVSDRGGHAAGQPAFEGVTALLVLSGAMRVHLPDGAAQVARAAGLVLIPAGIRPEMGSEGGAPAHVADGGACLVRCNGWLVADATRGQPAHLQTAAARINGTAQHSLSNMAVARLADRPEGRQALAMLRREAARVPAGATTLAVTLMSMCIVVGLRIALAASGERGTPRIVGRRAAVERAIAAVRSRPDDPHSIDTLARAAGMSRSTLTRYFRNALQTTPAAFIQRARLAAAAALLGTREHTIKAVAAIAGFASRSHFTRAFTAVDPTAWQDTDRFAGVHTKIEPERDVLPARASGTASGSQHSTLAINDHVVCGKTDT